MLALRTFFGRLLGSSRHRSRTWLLAAALLAVVPLAFFVDVPLARFCLSDKFPGDLQRILQWSEVFAHGFGVAILAGILYVMDVPRRRRLPRAIGSALGAGLIADIGKLLVARTRPHHLPIESNVLESFQGWCPVLFPVEGGPGLESQWMSFPSGHSAVAVAFAIALTAIYPRGRFVFGGLAILAMVQRIESGAHFLSDTLAGAAIGIIVAASFHQANLLGRYFDRFENRSVQTFE